MRLSTVTPASPRKSGRWWWVVVTVLIVLVSVVLVFTANRKRPGIDQAGDAVAVDNSPVTLINVVQQDGPRSLAHELAGKVESTEDDWDTEVLNESAGSQFAELARLIKHPEQIDVSHVAPLVAGDFACTALWPADLVQVLADENLVVRRSKSETATDETDLSAALRDAEGLVEALQPLLRRLGAGQERHAKFKLIHIEKSAKYFATRCIFEASARTHDTGVQLNAVWICRWQYPEPGNPERPRLEWIGIEECEEVVIRADRGRLFSDCTKTVFGDSDVYQKQVLPGLDHWVKRMDRVTGVSIFGYHGVTVGDVNGDGLEDVYVCDSGGLPNRLFVQQPDGTLTDLSAKSGVDYLDDSASSLLIDLDNDGDHDANGSTDYRKRWQREIYPARRLSRCCHSALDLCCGL